MIATMDNEIIPFGEKGIDDVEFYVSTNVGEPLKPLAKIASGGEISPMMLALKSIFSKEQGITSVIFDEIDTGVGGRVAQAIAEKISAISRAYPKYYVLRICHKLQLWQIPTFYISKQEVGGRVNESVCTLTFEEKVEEIATDDVRCGNDKITNDQARELFCSNSSKKNEENE